MADAQENGQQQPAVAQPDPNSIPLPAPVGFLQKFRLYETRSKFYMVGRDKGRTFWKILKIDRSEPSELNIHEDPTVYTERECSGLLRRIHEGNKTTGGLKFVTTCYGIVGFIRFLGPYYMLLITKRKQIGAICGHSVYAISESDIIPLPNSAVRSNMINHDSENRYIKLLGMVDLTKDFYFSYSYNVMRCLQRNMCDDETGQVLYETMFVWNGYLTRGIRNILQNTTWTVALVYGFFKQETLSISGRDLILTLIARRSRHYAGTRYLKRGVNEKGCVANDVEIEQILVEDVPDRLPAQISSIVQNRGSIPLFWSQETSRLNLRPDIILSKMDQTYEATRLHFENLVSRYGNPIIILNLIKIKEKRPRESILRAEFANAIEVINKDLPEENQLKFIHWDLNKHSRSKSTDVLLLLGKVASYALMLTGIFYCSATPEMLLHGNLKLPNFENFVPPGLSTSTCSHTDSEKHNGDETEDSDNSDRKSSGGNSAANGSDSGKPPMIQRGVLRTNCIDCLDRTNVAQYAYGLTALGCQLRALGVSTSMKLELDDPLAEELMGFYEMMGDTLAHQYGGSAAHNKIFSERRGQWKAAMQSQEFFRTLQRYYCNAYTDTEKQNAINIFLGNFQPDPDKPDVWELNSGHLCNMEEANIDENGRFQRSFSDGSVLSEESERGNKMHSESTPEIPAAERELACSRFTFSMPDKKISTEIQRRMYPEHEDDDISDCSNFVDLDWLSSGGNSCEELLDRSMLAVSPSAMASLDNVSKESVAETTASTSDCESSLRGQYGTELGLSKLGKCEADEELSDSFVQWVMRGETLCR